LQELVRLLGCRANVKRQLVKGKAMPKFANANPEPPQFLSGWKEIANYLRKSTRTVQRYEHQIGLPVRRPVRKPRGAVIATKAELDGWVKASPIREVFGLPGRNVKEQFRSSTISLKHAVAEMTALRDQMHELRADMRRSLHVLRESVFDLQEELDRNRWVEPSPFQKN
jgi:hypothetical protein